MDVVVPRNLDKKTREALEKIRDRQNDSATVKEEGDGQDESLFSRLRGHFRR